jgi:HK97 family phage major capsid protein
MPPLHPVAIKSETDETATVAGWGVVFDQTDAPQADLYGEFFTADTDFWLDDNRLGPKKVALYDHGFDDALKRHVVGTATLGRKTEGEMDGLWVEAQIAKADRYAKQVLELVRAGVLGWSSGAISHLIERESHASGKAWLKTWPIAEMSLTPSPAEFRTLGVEQLKALVEHAEALKALLPEDTSTKDVSAEGDAPHPHITVTDPPTPASQEDDPMSDERIAALEEQIAAMKATGDSLNTMLQKVLDQMENEPAIKNAGYFTQDGGTADKGVKSFGDFLLACKRGDVKRLHGVYGSVKDMLEGAGTTGGYLVPEEYHNELLQLTERASPIVGRVRRIPVRTDAGTFPALNQFDAPTAGSGNTAYAGGVVATNVAEGAALTETNATLKEIQYTIHKVGGYTEVSNELVADSAQSVDALLRALFSRAIMAKLERHILRGSGVGEPLGILNAPALINVSPVENNLFAYDDAVAMMARYSDASGGMGLWVHHPGVFPDIATMESPAGGAVWHANMAAGTPSNLLGLDLVRSQHLPQDDNSGDVILADFGAYLLFERQALTVAFSEHAAFTTDKGTWRFTYRCDGQPWVKGSITLADPQGSYTVSPYVSHND